MIIMCRQGGFQVEMLMGLVGNVELNCSGKIGTIVDIGSL